MLCASYPCWLTPPPSAAYIPKHQQGERAQALSRSEVQTALGMQKVVLDCRPGSGSRGSRGQRRAETGRDGHPQAAGSLRLRLDLDEGVVERAPIS